MKDSEFTENLVKAFVEKLKKQISTEGKLLMSEKEVKIEKIIDLSVTIQPGSLDLNQLLIQNSTNMRISGKIEIYPIGEGEEIKPTEFYVFEEISIKVTFNSEKKEFEFEN